MHLIFIADSKLCEAGYTLDHHIKDIVMNCANLKDLQIHIISDHSSNTLKDFCSLHNQIKLISVKESKASIKQYKKAVVVHFGNPLPCLKAFPHFFIPIIIPSDRTDISVIKRYLLKRKYNQWVKTATLVISLNDWSLDGLFSNYPSIKSSIVSLQLPFIEPPFIEWSEMSAAKDLLTNGNNYILIFAPVDNITIILKEFSVFKKWQQSTMHLVFILENKNAIEKANSILKGYKFRQDVSIYTTMDINSTILAASYLTIFENVQYSYANIVMNSIHFGVPLLFDDQIQLPEAWKSAGEVFSFAEKNALSNHFKLYYKDEVYRQSRAKMGSNWLQSLNQDRRTFELFNNIVLSHIK